MSCGCGKKRGQAGYGKGPKAKAMPKKKAMPAKKPKKK
jgi:hypothetical protein